MIYFDNAATTKIYSKTLEFMKEYSENNFYNPSALYTPALKVFNDIKTAKEELKNLLNFKNGKVVFTASATEANNFALRCFASKNKKILVSSGEHSCVYQTSQYLKEQGYEVDYILLNEDGTINLEDLSKKLTPNTGLVSVIHVNNETGCINDLKAVSKLIKQKCPQALLHSDGVQAFCKIDVNLTDLGVDLYTVSSHKVHGPRGVGALVFNSKLNPKPLIFGGGQEYNLRSGTENAAAILGFLFSAKQMHQNLALNYQHLSKLKQSLLKEIEELSPVINGSLSNSSPAILSVSFEGIKGEVLVRMLDEKDMYVSTGSSCNSKHNGNRVMLAMGKNKQQEAGNIRISFCEQNTQEEVIAFCAELKKNVKKIRELNIWKK